MSSRNWQPLGGKGHNGEILKQGYLRKLKTKKKKYFILRGDCGENAAQLEYYDNEKKWKANQPPKRVIVLKTCFNINKRIDIKQKWVIALYTKKDCFCIDFDNEDEMDSWLRGLIELQLGEDIPDGTPIKPTFEHVWPVSVLNKELGGRVGILGPYHLCLTDATLALVKGASNDPHDSIEFSLQKIRRCGHVDSFFYMEVGNCTVTGAGNLWMQTEDTYIAENMHATILRNCSKKDLQPKTRDRSLSDSKPNYLQRWSTHPEDRITQSKVETTSATTTSTSPTCSQQQTGLSVRERSDSLPSRARTISEGTPHLPPPARTHLVPSRPQSMYNTIHKGLSYSPPVGSSPVSPGSGACSDSAGSSLSVDGDSTDVTWETESGINVPIMEENSDEYAQWPGEEEKLNNNVNMDHTLNMSYHLTNSSTGIAYRKQSPNLGFKSSSPSQSQSPYMDICSPCGSSPLDQMGHYLAMSPGEGRSSLFGRAGSANHSRGSSFAEDGYVPMAPGSNEDYVEMDPKSIGRGNKSDRYQSGDTSAGSSCSITSGTPSTDIRLSEYPLDKVTTYFLPDEDIAPTERQARAYSVGSRPVNNNTRSEVGTPTNGERVRAFSVGSRNVRILGRANSLLNPHLLSSSHSSVEPPDDMMELDFSSKGKLKNRKKPNSSERLSVPAGSASTLSSAASSYSTAEGSCMEGSPRTSPLLAPSPPKTSRVPLLAKSPPKPCIPEYPCPFSKSSPPYSGISSPLLGRVLEADTDYMVMTSGHKGESRVGGLLSSLLRSSSALSKSPPDEPYVEMKPGHVEAKQVLVKNTKARMESFPATEPVRPHQLVKSTSSPPIKPTLLSTKGGKVDHFDVNLKRKTSLLEDNNNSKIAGFSTPGETPTKENDGYVEMSLGTQKQKAGENEPNYMNMSGRKDRKGSKNDISRYSSQPITIQAVPKDPSTLFAFTTRKHSTGTPPKVPSFLPLDSASPSSSPHSTLGRNRTRKNSTRRGSKDTGTGLITPTGSTSALFPFSSSSPSDSPGDYESSSKILVDVTSGTVHISYDEDHESLLKRPAEKPVDDYVNFQPKKNDSDYISMQPLNSSEPCRKISAPVLGSKARAIEKLVYGLGSLTVSSPAFVTVPSPQSVSESESSINSRLSEEDLSNSSIVKSEVKSVSRTPSVSSVGEKELHYASLDLKKCGSDNEESNKNLKTQSSLTESSSASTPSPNIMPDSSAFGYAKIDFEKSAASRKLRH